ncbi:hypothetical protein NDU88_006484 [Pleurodeles waltl]|uniref:Uncharacterized protein n=1 Tax=Pleurodeles waltl TaxID=8319 RepID=A0AAV7TXZ4_PLEWA|nr:hypothetical protein NDU88_006484 [Pleurodeles waltl]
MERSSKQKDAPDSTQDRSEDDGRGASPAGCRRQSPRKKEHTKCANCFGLHFVRKGKQGLRARLSDQDMLLQLEEPIVEEEVTAAERQLLEFYSTGNPLGRSQAGVEDVWN